MPLVITYGFGEVIVAGVPNLIGVADGGGGDGVGVGGGGVGVGGGGVGVGGGGVDVGGGGVDVGTGVVGVELRTNTTGFALVFWSVVPITSTRFLARG